MLKPLKENKISRYQLLKVGECFWLDVEATSVVEATSEITPR
jgi:hypothetical protein